MSSPFPLRLTPLEEYFVLGDQPGYPNQIVCHLTLDGKLERAAWEKTVEEGLRRHVMFSVKAVGKPGSRSWVATDRGSDICVWHERDEPGLPALPYLDVKSGQNARINVVRRRTHDEILLQTHHAITDGIGGMRTIQELLMIYENELEQATRHKIRSLDNERLRLRNHFPKSFRDRLKSIPAVMIGTFGAIKYFLRRAAPLGSQGSVSGFESEQTGYIPPIITHQFSLDESEQLRRAAELANVTVNGLMIRDLYLAIRDWQDHYQHSREGRCLRVMIPINLRTIADRRLGAGNRVSLVYLDRNDREMRRPEELLWGINFEIKTIQRMQLSLFALTCLKLLSRMPGWLRKQSDTKTCRATAILTNLGEPFGNTQFQRDDQDRVVAGGLTITAMELAAPLRPLTHAAVSVFRYANRVHVSLHYDASSIPKGQAEGLMRRYCNHISKSLHKAKKDLENEPSSPPSAAVENPGGDGS